MKNAAFMTAGGERAIRNAYDGETRDFLGERLHFIPGVYRKSDFEERKAELAHVEIVFSTWGMFSLGEEKIERFLPNLRAVFYAAGSVQAFARPFLRRGVRIFSAFAANAVPVAEFTAAQIVLANKGYFQAARLYSAGKLDEARKYAGAAPGNYREAVGVVGAGTIGRLVIEKLRGMGLPVRVFDPFLSDGGAEKLGVKKCGLPTLFSECRVVTNHLANNAQTRGMLDYGLFSKMKTNGTFINTGRGAQVVEKDLARALREEPERTALLDVTDPEPVPKGSPFTGMPNVFLTPHIAGSMNGEVARMGRYMAEEYGRVESGKAPKYEVTAERLATMA